jgi:hypothetical protein
MIQTQLNAHLLAGEAEFKVLGAKKGKATEEMTLFVKKDGIRIKEGEALIVKEDFNPQLKVIINTILLTYLPLDLWQR